MEILITHGLFLIMGILLHALWCYLFDFGTSIRLIRRAIVDGMLILAKNIQTVAETSKIKYNALAASGKSEKYIEFQKAVDDAVLISMRNTAIRNFVNTVPTKYDYLVPFQDWDGGGEYLNKINKGENK